MSSKRMVMVLVRNVQIGQVKKRLAKTLGDERALNIYINLLHKTADTMQEVQSHKSVFYSEYIDEADEFMVPVFQKHLQMGEHFGKRCANAFVKYFSRGYQQVMLVNANCYALTPAMVEEAFNALDTHDVVLGPSADGGYYLAGMKQFNRAFFEHKEWHGENVLVDTLIDIQRLNLTCHLLPTLPMVYEAADLDETLKKVR